MATAKTAPSPDSPPPRPTGPAQPPSGGSYTATDTGEVTLTERTRDDHAEGKIKGAKK